MLIGYAIEREVVLSGYADIDSKINFKFDKWLDDIWVRGFSKSTEEKNRDIVRKRLEPYRLKLLDHVTNYVPEKRIISEVYESKDICCLVFDIGKKKQYSTEYFSENIFNYNSPILEEFKNEIQSLVNDKVIQKDYLTKDMGSLFIRELAYLKYFYRFFDVNYCSIYHVVEVNIETSETLRIGEK